MGVIETAYKNIEPNDQMRRKKQKKSKTKIKKTSRWKTAGMT